MLRCCRATLTHVVNVPCRVRSSQQELEAAYCSTLTAQTRVNMRYYAVMVLIPLLFVAGITCSARSTIAICGPRVYPTSVTATIGTLIMLSGAVTTLLVSMIRRLSLAAYERVFITHLIVLIIFGPLAHRWRGASFQLLLQGDPYPRADTCVSEACEKMATDTILLLCFATVTYASSGLLPRVCALPGSLNAA